MERGASVRGGRAGRGACGRGERGRQGTERGPLLGGAEGNNYRRTGGFENLPGADMDYFTSTMEQLHEFLSVSKPLLCARFTALIGQVCTVSRYSARTVCMVQRLLLHVLSGRGVGLRPTLSGVQSRAGTCVVSATKTRDIVH